MKKKSGFVDGSGNGISTLDGEDMAESNISDPELYKQMVHALSEMRHRDWNALADRLDRLGIKNKHGKPWAAGSTRVVFYQLQKRYRSMGVKNLANLTGKLPPAAEASKYAEKVLTQIEAVLKLDGVDNETKLDLIEKVLK